MDNLSEGVRIKCIEKMERLEECGYDLRRPHCDILESGVYELRMRRQNVNYRILYRFIGENEILISHGCTKEREMPEAEIKRALRNSEIYLQNPKAHTYRGEW
jgi:phage-related protein